MTDNWFSMHLPDDVARTMDRAGYRLARAWLRRAQHILRLRYASARINPDNPNEILFPALEDVIPEKFK